MAQHPLGAPYATYNLLAPEYLHSLQNPQYTPDTTLWLANNS